MRHWLIFILTSVATCMSAGASAQTGAAAPSDRRAPPGGVVQGAVGSAGRAPAPVHVGTRAGCSSPPCVTTALAGSSVAPALFYEKARLLGGARRADYHVKLCVFPSTSLSRCPAEAEVTYYPTPLEPMASLGDLRTIRFDGVSAVPGCFVLRWDKPEQVSTPFAIIATSRRSFPCAGR